MICNNKHFLILFIFVSTIFFCPSCKKDKAISTPETTSTEKGNWTTNGPNGSVSIQSLGTIGNKVFANVTLNGIYISNDNGENWLTTNNGLPIANSFLAMGNMLVTAIKDSSIFVSKFLKADTAGLFVSNDKGVSWTQINNGIPITQLVTSIVSNGNNIFAGTWKMNGNTGGIYISTNNGNNWTAVNNGLPTNAGIRALAVNGNNIFASTDTSGIFLSNDNGNSWTAVNNGILTKRWINSLIVCNNKIFAGTSTGILSSSDNGSSWAFVNNGIPIIAGGSNSISNSPHVAAITDIVSNGNFIFALAQGLGVYFSTDNGTIWSPANNGLNSRGYIDCLTVNSTYIFAGTGGGQFGAIWRSPLTAFQ